MRKVTRPREACPAPRKYCLQPASAIFLLTVYDSYYWDAKILDFRLGVIYRLLCSWDNYIDFGAFLNFLKDFLFNFMRDYKTTWRYFFIIFGRKCFVLDNFIRQETQLSLFWNKKKLLFTLRRDSWDFQKRVLDLIDSSFKHLLVQLEPDCFEIVMLGRNSTTCVFFITSILEQQRVKFEWKLDLLKIGRKFLEPIIRHLLFLASEIFTIFFWFMGAVTFKSRVKNWDF